MDKRFVGVFAFAVVVALATSYAVYRMFSGQVAQQAKAQSQRISVAGRDLTPGTVLKAGDLRDVDWSSPLPKGAVTSRDELLDRAVVTAVSDGEVLTEPRLAKKGGGSGLAATIPAGKRAIAIRVDDVVGLAGFVLPGMKVDVIALGRPDTSLSRTDLGTQARTLLQNVQVLSAGQNTQTDPSGKPITVNVVNLLCSPEEAEVISLASNTARIQLVLRNPLDSEETKTPGTSSAYLFSGQVGRPLPNAPAALEQTAAALQRPGAPAKRTVTLPKTPSVQRVVVPVTIEIINGTKKDNVKVGETVEERPATARKDL